MHSRSFAAWWLLWSALLLLLLQHDASFALDSGGNPTCSLKDHCSLNEDLVALAGQPLEEATKFEDQIASIFEDKVNYSLQLFADESTILEYSGQSSTGANRSGAAMAARRTENYNLTHSREFEEVEEVEDVEEVEENERAHLHHIKEKFLSIARPFDAARNPHASPACRADTRRYLEALQNFDLWALRMHDSTGKLHSGVLNGNINQIGDFDQCLGVKHKIPGGVAGGDGDNDAIIRGQYCLAYAQPKLPHKSKKLRAFFQLLQSHGPFRSDFNDPGHRVPRYSLINWGICVPSSCSHEDIEYTVKEYLSNVTASTGITFQVRVEPQMCQVEGNKPWDRGTTWAVRFFLVILSIAILSTVYECNSKVNKPNDWLTAFSLRKNLRWLFSTDSSPDDIQTVHGIRFLNAVMLLLSHKSMAMFFNPYDNRTEMAESLGRSWTVIGRAASLYTDPFLLFSGMLTAYSLFGRLFKGQPVRLRNEYMSRLMRIVPPLAALILFCTYVMPLWGSGPQWNLVVGHHAKICKKNWWRNLLFIHNYFGFSEMCLTHTHHLGIDTELFAVAPVMILGLWKWPRGGLFTLVSLAAVGTGARYYTTIANQLSNYIYFGTNIQRLFRTADLMYSFPPHRSTVYIMGVLLGYGLRRLRGIKLSSAQLRAGWLAATICVLVSLLVPAPMGQIGYQYNATHAAIYAAFAPIAWCTFFAWIVFASHNGYTNKFTNFLSWRGFQVTTKLSYAIYLTQFPVFFFNVGRRRHVHHYYNFVSIFLDTNEFICIFLASVALTIFFDAPFQNIKKLLFRRQTSVAPAASASTLATRKRLPNGTATEMPSSDVSASKAALMTTHATTHATHAHVE